MFGFFSVRRSSAFAPLVETDKSLWRQSFADPGQNQKDGWGLAWYPGATPRLFKSPGSLPREKKVLEKIAGRAAGRAILFHLRRASNPRGLPKARLRGRENVQPFCFGRWTFVHNGSLPFPEETSRLLGPYRKRLRGVNDSEVLFWLLIKELRRLGSVGAALRAVRRELKKVHRAVFAASSSASGKKPSPVRPGPPHRGLNILLTDGNRLWAYAEAPPGFGRTGGALGSPRWPYFQLAFLPTEDKVWVASEPLWSGGRWRPVFSGQVLELRRRPGRRGARIAWSIKRISIKEGSDGAGVFIRRGLKR